MITQETDNEVTLTARGMLDSIFDQEDIVATHRKGTQARKDSEIKLLKMYKEYNTYMEKKIFCETKVDI